MKNKQSSFLLTLLFPAFLMLSGCNGGGGGGSSPPASNSASSTDYRPVANAGADQIVTEGQLVTLNGKDSFDPEGATILFQWRQLSGAATTLSSETDDSPSFIAPNGNHTLTFQLVIDDGKNISIGDTVTITVKAASASNNNTGETNNSGNTGNTGSNGGTSGTDTNTDGSTSGNDSSNNNSGTDNSTDGNNSSTDTNSGTDSSNGSDTSNNGSTDQPDNTTPVTPNTAPIADAGEDRVVSGFSLVVLDATLSSDAENDTLSYSWTQISGTSVVLSATNIAKPNFDAPDINDTLIFSVTVNDGELSSQADTVTIQIQKTNAAPIARAGQDRTIAGLSQASLQGSSSSDPDGDTLSYLWQQTDGPAVTLSNTRIANPVFTAPNQNASLTFSLVVNDGELSSSADTVVITVEAINTAPTANAGQDQSLQGLEEVILNGSLSSDPEGDLLSYTWSQTQGSTVSLLNSDSVTPTFIAPNNNEILIFSLIVNDGSLNSISDTVAISVQKINTIPTAHAGVDRYVGSLSVVALNGTLSSDADNDPITYRWTQISGPSVTLSDPKSAKPIFTADTDGQLLFSLTVNDGQNDSAADTVKVTVGPIPATNIKVNGTGITWGGSYPTGNNTECIGQAIEQQDCSLGRELTHNDDSDGRAGFSFKKFDANGVDVGNNASEWQCVQDSVTGLMWEIKTGGNGVIGDEGTNDADDRFSWYNSDPASNGGGSGFMNNQGEVCANYDANNPETFCNTQAFVARMNKVAWCGFADWRMPTRKELLSIVDYGNGRPMVDEDYFPEVGQFIWTNTPLALGSVSAWGVNFNYGNSFSIDKRNARQVRLVRGGYDQAQ